MSDSEQMWTPATGADVTDEKLVAGQLRALQGEVRSGFELITTKLLTALERLNNRFDALADDVIELKREQVEMRARLAALESKPTRRSPARKR